MSIKSARPVLARIMPDTAKGMPNELKLAVLMLEEGISQRGLPPTPTQRLTDVSVEPALLLQVSRELRLHGPMHEADFRGTVGITLAKAALLKLGKLGLVRKQALTGFWEFVEQDQG